MQDYLTTAEVAAYLRLKERTIYELVRTRRIPHARITGKHVFPRRLIDLWAMEAVEFVGGLRVDPPPVVAGSQDPLLEWALRESGSDLAMLPCGSLGGVVRLAEGRAVAAALHLPDDGLPEALLRLADLVVIEWARRRQGLVTAPGNPLALSGVADLTRPGLRVARRQEGAGAHLLLVQLLAAVDLDLGDLATVEPPALSEADLCALVHAGRADVGLAVESEARRLGLGFVPLAEERFDLALRRRDYFEPPWQRLLAFAAAPRARAEAARLGGYDLAGLGRVVRNG